MCQLPAHPAGREHTEYQWSENLAAMSTRHRATPDHWYSVCGGGWQRGQAAGVGMPRAAAGRRTQRRYAVRLGERGQVSGRHTGWWTGLRDGITFGWNIHNASDVLGGDP
ncbi:MAG TPA: hypothetical protein PLK64_07490 [Dermatophilaceae bacterium]|nr:hypothetical protein [Dermatophilaceae bacterium]